MAERRPLVSIIVPTHNRPVMLARAVASLLAQTVRDLEVLVIDDGGRDPSPVLAGFGDARVRLHRLPSSHGPSAARNVGLALARAPYIAYLDDDDLALPHHLATLLDTAERTGAAAVYSDGHETFERWDGDVATVLHRRLVYSQDFALAHLLCDNIMAMDAVLHRRDALRMTGGFDQSLPMHVDWEMWIRLALTAGDFVHVPTLTFEYTTRPGTVHMRERWHAGYLQTFQWIHRRYAAASRALGVTERQAVVRARCATFAAQQASRLPLERLERDVARGLLHAVVAGESPTDAPMLLGPLAQLVQAARARLGDRTPVRLALAALARLSGRPADAIAALDGALADVTYEGLVHAELALACGRLGRRGDAQRHAERAFSLTGRTPEAIADAPPPAVPSLAPARAA